MVSKIFNDKRSRGILSPLLFRLFCFFFQQARKSLFCGYSIENHNFSLCEGIEDIVKEMKVKGRGKRRK